MILKIKKITGKNYEIDQCSYYTTIYLKKFSLRFQKRKRTVFEKHKLKMIPAYITNKVSEYYDINRKCSEVFNANSCISLSAL